MKKLLSWYFWSFKATNIIDIKGSEFFKNMDDAELRKHVNERNEHDGPHK